VEINKMKLLDFSALMLGLSAPAFNDFAQGCFYALSCLSLSYSVYLKYKNQKK
jgi:hypothetical protein